MQYEGDAFISYAHLDNLALVEGHKGWVANLQRALEIRVSQLRGKKSEIWWDPKLQGNDFFADTLVLRLQHVAVLVSVVTPRYVNSDWGRKELLAFIQAAEQQGGIRVDDKCRVFKVLKTPVARDLHPPELRPLLGYEFFKVDPETGRLRELNEAFGDEAQKEFWIKLDDLAYDMCQLLERLEAPAPTPTPRGEVERGGVFLAETTADLQDQREAIKRNLLQHGYTVLPDRALPQTAADMKTAIRDNLSHCRMSIHLVGRHYSLVPEGGKESLLEIQNDLAIERGEKEQFSRLVWMPPGLQVDDERQQRFVDQLRMEPRVQRGAADLLETPLEELWTVIDAWLNRQQRPPQMPETSAPPQGHFGRIYLIYDKRDSAAVSPWADYLFHDFEVIHPVFDGDETDLREYHQENLRNCDGVLIFYGAANATWLGRKLRELEKSAGYGRTKPAAAVAVCLIPPKTPDKERFRTHEAIVIPQWDGFSPESLQSFISNVKRQPGGTAG